MEQNRAHALKAHVTPHPPKPPEQSKSRAGRNLKLAVPTAVILLALVAASVLIKIEAFVVLVAVALCIGIWEAAGAFLARRVRIPLVPLWIGTCLMVWSTWVHGLGGTIVFFVVSALFVFAIRLIDGEHRSPSDALAALFALGWISLLGCFAVALAALDKLAWMIAVLVLMPVANDTGGWIFGVLWGKHPMSPTISPKKSWEGLAGSFVLSAIISVLLIMVALERPWYVAVVVALVSVVCATVGDLSESLLKRDLGVKDMGSIFPGHGGMLDRLDSILMWAPFCYLIMAG